MKTPLLRLLLGSLAGLLAVLLIPEAVFAIDEFAGFSEQIEPVAITAAPGTGLWLGIGRLTSPGGGVIEVRLPAAEIQSLCTIPKQHSASAERAKKQLERAGCQYRARAGGWVPSISPEAAMRVGKVVRMDCKRKRCKLKRAVLERLIAVQGGLEQ